MLKKISNKILKKTKNEKRIDLKSIIAGIAPDSKSEKEAFDTASKFINDLNKDLKKINAKAILGGSGAKGTWLDLFDIDVFVRFNYSKYKDKSDKLSEFLYPYLKAHAPDRLRGSRDYFIIKKENFSIEVVPILDIKDSKQALNITDVSPLHTDYVNKKLKAKNDVKLLKKFLKTSGIYGAESYVQGFSGYVCELLIINYKSFNALVKSASKWQDKVFIDIEKFYKGKNINIELNKSKLVSPIVIIDPVQKDRNAAAAISSESFIRFKEVCSAFLKNPSEKFFSEQEININLLKKNNVVVQASTSGKHDVAGARLLKVFEYLKENVKNYGFKIKSGWKYSDEKAVFWFSAKDIDPEVILAGPPLSMKTHVLNFKKKHKKVFEKSKVLYAREKRKFTRLKDCLDILIKTKYVTERVISVKIV